MTSVFVKCWRWPCSRRTHFYLKPEKSNSILSHYNEFWTLFASVLSLFSSSKDILFLSLNIRNVPGRVLIPANSYKSQQTLHLYKFLRCFALNVTQKKPLSSTPPDPKLDPSPWTWPFQKKKPSGHFLTLPSDPDPLTSDPSGLEKTSRLAEMLLSLSARFGLRMNWTLTPLIISRLYCNGG